MRGSLNIAEISPWISQLFQQPNFHSRKAFLPTKILQYKIPTFCVCCEAEITMLRDKGTSYPPPA